MPNDQTQKTSGENIDRLMRHRQRMVKEIERCDQELVALRSKLTGFDEAIALSQGGEDVKSLDTDDRR